MPIHTDRAVPSTFLDLRLKVRRMLADTDSQRWSDEEVDEGIYYSLAWMYNRASGKDGWGLQTVTLDVPNGAEVVELPEILVGLDIVRVEDTTDPDAPIRMQYTSLAGMRRSGSSYWNVRGDDVGSLRYTFIDNAISILPKNRGDRTLTIYYVGAPFSVGAETDQHGYPSHHEELICVGAANRLTNVFDETPMAMQLRHQKLEKEYIQDIRRFEGPQRIRKVRRGIR